MAAKHTRHIALTAPLAQWAEEMIARGEYASISDLVRTALRRLQAEHAAGPLTDRQATAPPPP